MALLNQGGLTLGRIAGVPLRLHWTALLGAYVFTGFHFDTVAWLTFFGLIIAHELGHALVVKAAKAKATLIELTGYGGLCHWEGEVTPIARACIAWGGVWAQLLLLAGAYAWLQLGGVPRDLTAWRVLHTLTDSNAWMIALNLLPIPPLDGFEAWRLPVLLGRVLRGGAAGATVPTPVVMSHGAEDDFEVSPRRDEVKAIVSSLLEEARKP